MLLLPMENASHHRLQALPSRLPVYLDRGALQWRPACVFKNTHLFVLAGLDESTPPAPAAEAHAANGFPHQLMENIQNGNC
jgi:hypothetical protein